MAGGRSPLPLLFAAGLGVLSGLYIWKQPLAQYTEEQKNKGKPLVPPSDISPKVSEEIKAAATAPSTDQQVAFDSARAANSEHGVPSKRS